ncbi:antitoxin ParD1/3/4 [Rhizobium leguminosarum]|uniref:type II toxin-antitoxin system ParD family antitoxin n=1 Tax=Rhizobium leguminosarum TaxID=384 RepID=UPI00161B8826|nr:type II toxin-antitoxin system ParD family antitoxin [Rhizobium leguminosarum]MBB5666422.1 antitoxin ParD1/3/4 [Rhizobium leguminosarum]
MASDANLEPQQESYVDGCMKSEREQRLGAFDLAIGQGIADAAAGRLKPISDVAARLMTKYDDRS